MVILVGRGRGDVYEVLQNFNPSPIELGQVINFLSMLPMLRDHNWQWRLSVGHLHRISATHL